MDAAGRLAAELLAAAPHIAWGPGRAVWLDARGIGGQAVAARALAAACRHGVGGVLAGVAAVPVAAEVAARFGVAPGATDAASFTARATPAPAGTTGAVASVRGGPPNTIIALPATNAVTTVTRARAKSRAATSARAQPAENHHLFHEPPTDSAITEPPADPAIVVVPQGRERSFLAGHLVGVLGPVPRLATALADVGIERCGELTALSREAVETRLGPEGAALWRLARGDDRRLLFDARPRELPSASLVWDEYDLRNLEQLVFPANAIVGAVCEALRARGQVARRLGLTLTLASGKLVGVPLRAARPTADRATWLRLVRAALGRLTLVDGITGLCVRVDAADGADAPQGDLFDRGFQSAEAAEAVLARLIDDGDVEVLGLTTTNHPAPERRARWAPRPPVEALRLAAGRRAQGVTAHFTLQLLPAPRRVAVTTRVRRGERVPVRYRERRAGGREVEVHVASGPDLITGGRGSTAPYARAYFHCLTSDGTLVLLFHDRQAESGDGAASPGGDAAPDAAPGRGARGAWFLHGWWD